MTVVVAIAVAASQAGAHIERASYWPEPSADTGVSPPAGGKVPRARSLFSALKKAPPGNTHVVCQGTVPSKKRLRAAKRRFRRNRTRANKRAFKSARRDYRASVKGNASMQALAQGLRKARTEGYRLRPSEPAIRIGKRRAKRLRRFNGRLLAKCRYDAIQDAVTAAGNNDRVVIMPGLYTEPKSRARPTDDPKCAHLKQENDERLERSGVVPVPPRVPQRPEPDRGASGAR